MVFPDYSKVPLSYCKDYKLFWVSFSFNKTGATSLDFAINLYLHVRYHIHVDLTAQQHTNELLMQLVY